MAKQEKPHAVCIPYPTQGHINPMLRLAKLLHHKGFHITFVHTEYNYKRLLKSRGVECLKGFPSFRFETIPDGLPLSDEGDVDATLDISSLCESTSSNCLGPLRELLAKLNNTSLSKVPHVSCIVSETGMGFTVEAAQELGVPGVFFWPGSADALLAFKYFHVLIEKGVTPLKDESYLTNGYLDTVLDLPGLNGIRLRDMPSFTRTTNPDDFMLKYIVENSKRDEKASAIVLNTFEELEHDAIEALLSFMSPIYTVSPLHFLESQVDDESLKVLGSNLWVEMPECLEWLDSKEPNSVIYISFGSIATMKQSQFEEFAFGVANSNQNFLWVIRPDLVSGGSAIHIPSDFVDETRERGLLSGWCNQEKVLKHPAIGGFLTHSGWNSTLESISFGVPMICWPYFSDQQTNCWYCCSQLGIGIELKNDANRHEVESMVRELMVGDKGKEMRGRAMEWSKKSKEAANFPEGSSYLDLDKLINQLLLF